MYLWRNILIILIGLVWTSLVHSIANIDNVKFVFYESPTVSISYNLNETAIVFNDPKYKSNGPNVLYIPRYLDSPNTATTQAIVNAYFNLETYNVFALDWSYLASGTYASAVENENRVGTNVGEAYIPIIEAGADIENLYIVGFDIGAQLAGQIGRILIARSNGAYKIHRITGLDPAFHLYYPPIAGIQHLNSNDATFVDVIHTDGGGYGTPGITGTVDFLVNTGRRFQPGCPVGTFLPRSDKDLCSHQRSTLLWAESASSPFTATLLGNAGILSSMGINCSINSTPGIYKILTNSMTPRG